MKRLLAIALVALPVVVAVPAYSDQPDGDAPGRDSVHGGGINAPPEPFPANHFAFNANSGPAGEAASGEGHFIDNDARRRFNGTISCLRVAGNQASFVIDFRNTKNQPPSLVDGWDVVLVEDNGEPTGGDPVDYMTNRLVRSDQAPPSCPAPVHPARLIGAGNIHVHDG